MGSSAPALDCASMRGADGRALRFGDRVLARGEVGTVRSTGYTGSAKKKFADSIDIVFERGGHSVRETFSLSDCQVHVRRFSEPVDPTVRRCAGPIKNHDATGRDHPRGSVETEVE